MNDKRPTVLMILDGYGESDVHEHNAVYLANTPVMDKLKAECPFQKGGSCCRSSGWPDGQF